MPANGTTPRAPQPITSNSRAFQSGNRPPQGQASNPRAVQQLKPNALPGRHSASNILVSNRQHGNPVLKEIKSQAWEYADIPADYVLGATTCALYLSLKYHRIHPDYIYTRIRDLRGQYNLRVLLTMVDVANHEEHLKELSKTSLINNVTLILCWSVAEAARYLELYKTYEHAPATAIKAPTSQAHGDKLIEFITTPRSITKSDAVMLVSNFGSVRTAVNAGPQELFMVDGLGKVKVKQWHAAVTEPFRARRAAKRGMGDTPNISRDASRAEGQSTPGLSRGTTRAEGMSTPGISRDASRAEGDDAMMSGALAPGETDSRVPDADRRPPKRAAEDDEADEDEEEAMRAIMNGMEEHSNIPPARVRAPPGTSVNIPKQRKEPEESAEDEGVMAALARLRKG